MTRAGDCIVRTCNSLNDIPAALLCVVIFLLQTAAMDYFLIQNISLNHWSWLGPDAINLTLLVVSIANSHAALHGRNNRQRHFYSLAWISWLLMSVFVSVKTIVVFNDFASQLREEDPSFFGPNTLKTAIALGSCVFFLLLTTQHDAPLGSERRRYIEELTGTVVFDIVDTVDILEILFTQDKVDTFWTGLKEFILAVASLNLLIPTVPLLTLNKTNFGHNELDKRLVYLHKLLVVLAVNVPNLLVRLILWHGFSATISPFTLKNIILIAMSVYEFYQHKKEKYEEHQREEMEMKNTKENQRFSNGLNSQDRLENSSEYERNHGDKRRASEFGFPVEERTVTDL